MGVKVKKARSVRRRTEHPMRARLVYVEPSEDNKAITERVWAMLLGEPDEGILKDPRTSEGESA